MNNKKELKHFCHSCLYFWDGKSKGTLHNSKLANDDRTILKIYNYIEHKFVKGK